MEDKLCELQLLVALMPRTGARICKLAQDYQGSSDFCFKDAAAADENIGRILVKHRTRPDPHPLMGLPFPISIGSGRFASIVDVSVIDRGRLNYFR
ncbi:hypothetical protein [Novosphingobium sp. YAF33]|uniref:hypothetical protein n=1 Tax=Novosphingobium sp. YAF33 TaxID=3233082 RepID=UPI003F9AFBDE